MWTRGVDVVAAADEVWRLLTDVRRWPDWGPTVSAARLEVGRSTMLEPGSTGRLRTPLGVWLPFTVTRWHDDGARRAWAWRVGGVPATSHEVLGDGTACRVRFGVPAWAPAYVPVVELALRRIQRIAEQETAPTAGERPA